MSGGGRQGVEQNLAAVGAIVGRKTQKRISVFTQMGSFRTGESNPAQPRVLRG